MRPKAAGGYAAQRRSLSGQSTMRTVESVFVKPDAFVLLRALRVERSSNLAGDVDSSRLQMRRPLSITIVGWLFVGMGAATAIGGLYPIVAAAWQATGAVHERLAELTPMVLSAVLALAGGVWILLGRDLGRWLAAAWMGAHIVLSLFHSVSQLLVHAVLFAVIVFFLFRPAAAAYFRHG
jgi:hypothetical protein